MKKVRKVLMPLFCVLMAVCLCVTANAAYTLTCWYAYEEDGTEHNKISTWTKDAPISFAYKKLNTNSDFDFYESCLEAQNAWAPALGITFSNVELMEDAQIQAYGGTKAEMQAAGFDVTPNTIGRNYLKSRTLQNADYNGVRKNIMRNTAAVIQVYDIGRTATLRHKDITHQLGHALGWREHSVKGADLMYKYTNYSEGLTDRDKNHLKQVY